MKTSHLAKLALVVAFALPASTTLAQTAPTAIQRLQVSAFGGLTGTYTNFLGGKNAGITLGGDLTFMTVPHVKPSFELRGTAPIDGGHVDSQLNFLLGPKVEYRYNRFHPYADFLFGRGQITYENGGVLYNNTLYLKTTSFIYSLGGGLDYQLTDHWGAKFDYQFQHWDTPFVGTVYNPIHPKAITLGVTYRFNFNRGYRRR
ncbi:hypothetical protein GCM10011507_29460 [Edaphobacter acidisoli]|uniref:Outer membrane protein beta-barrel domain-containing protein n=1 Tax=Edaphobacter acidisoli TaxID=2040573 RepID=A0A916S0K7_9BACT|nr:outer membrane beta-barrel protein [Edaphobacter acidisoli]GGA76163.1 hypothetical protein GCM10011507_29460 [Edaphobacter acidisoli]